MISSVRTNVLLHLAVLVFIAPSGKASVILSKEFIDVASRAAEFCVAVFEGDRSIPGAISFFDANGEPDAAMFVKENDTCYGVFRGTTMNIVDWFQNVDFMPATVYSSFNVPCHVQRGFRDAFEASYVELLEMYIRSCQASCTGGCDVVFTGHSQGAAASLIAAIMMDDLAPTVISFGEPRCVIGSCPPLDTISHIHFLNTVRSGIGLAYDPTPFIPLTIGDPRGDWFLLSPDDDQNIAYYAGGNGVEPSILQWSTAAHSDDSYVERFHSFQAANSFPLGIDGWRIGSTCNFDSECISTNRCVNNVCSVEDPCDCDGECAPGLC